MRGIMQKTDGSETDKVPGREGSGLGVAEPFTDGESSDTMEEDEIEEAVREAIEGGRRCSYSAQVEAINESRSIHILEGSKSSNHKWDKLVPNKNWEDIKYIIAYVMEFGEEGTYKTVFSKKAIINGFEVEVTYAEVGGTKRISDAWVK